MTATKSKSRIYRIADKLTGDVAFIRSPSMSQAINWMRKGRHRYVPRYRARIL